MKIVMINGTMRKSTTYTIGRMFIDRVKQEGDTVKELFLPKDMPEFCRGCGICFLKDEKKCPDYLIYMKHITEMLDEADLLVFTTPVFVFHATGQMKALLDHYGYRWMLHRPEESMFRKQAVCISTAAGGGMKRAVKDITDSLRFWGVAGIHTYGIAVKSVSWEGVDAEIKTKIDADLQTLVQKIIRDPAQVKPGIVVRILFYAMRHGYKKEAFGNEADVRYWQDKGWLKGKRPW